MDWIVKGWKYAPKAKYGRVLVVVYVSTRSTDEQAAGHPREAALAVVAELFPVLTGVEVEKER